MAQIQQIAKKKKTASYVTTAVALELVSLFGFAYATDSNVPGIGLLAATSIFIDGTKDIFPTNTSQAPDRMKDTLGGAYNQCSISCSNNVYIDYSRDFGILTGGVGYDQSALEATNKTIQAIRDAQAQNPGDPIYVVGYSQGATASSNVIQRAQELNSDNDPTNNLDLSNVTFVMVGNPARNDGGMFARLPAGVYVPFLGVSFGASTNPTTGPNAPQQVIMISKQYDGASDVPKYVMNPVAWANTMAGFYYVHTGYYADVNFDPKAYDANNNGILDQSEIDTINSDPQGRYVVTSNGNVVDVLIKNQPGDLPLTRPLLDMGVPPELVKAIDPILRAIIETAYDRPTNGVYPATPVHFGLIPGPSQWVTDITAIAKGLAETEKNLDNLNQANLMQANQIQAAKAAAPAPAIAPAPPAAPPAPKNWVPWTPHTKDWSLAQPVVTPPPPPPPAVEELPPPVQDEVLVQKATPSNGLRTNVVRGPIGGSPTAPGLNKIVTAINGVVTGTVTAIQNALTPKPAGTSTPSSSAPETPSDPGGSQPSTDAGTGGSQPSP